MFNTHNLLQMEQSQAKPIESINKTHDVEGSCNRGTSFWLGKATKTSKDRLWSLPKEKGAETADVVKKRLYPWGYSFYVNECGLGGHMNTEPQFWTQTLQQSMRNLHWLIKTHTICSHESHMCTWKFKRQSFLSSVMTLTPIDHPLKLVESKIFFLPCKH